MFQYFCKLSLKMKIHCFNQKMFCTSSLSPLQLPSRMETHLWYVLPNEVKSQSLLSRYVDLLPPLEKDYVFSMRGDHLCVRLYLDIHSRVSPRSLVFRKNSHGKPEVIWEQSDDWRPPPLHFNLSHTSSLIACGLTVGSPIGIDVEEKQRKMKNNILSFAKRYFSCEEVEVLSGISDPEVQLHEFIKLWTLKEAYVKALGIGFSGAPFNTFTIRFKSANPYREDSAIEIVPLEKPTNLTTNWQFAQVELAGSHYAAVCRQNDALSGGASMKVIVRETIPLVEEHGVSVINSHAG